MTAAPGPQQPDEVCTCTPGAPECRKCATSFPAAPLAHPDERDWRTETVEEQAARYGLPVELLNARVTFTAPAQPVRDTEEGRRAD